MHLRTQAARLDAAAGEALAMLDNLLTRFAALVLKAAPLLKQGQFQMETWRALRQTLVKFHITALQRRLMGVPIKCLDQRWRAAQNQFAEVSDGRLLRVLQIIPGWPRAGDAKGPQPGSKSSSSSSGSGLSDLDLDDPLSDDDETRPHSLPFAQGAGARMSQSDLRGKSRGEQNGGASRASPSREHATADFDAGRGSRAQSRNTSPSRDRGGSRGFQTKGKADARRQKRVRGPWGKEHRVVRSILVAEWSVLRSVYTAYSGVETESPPRLMSRREFFKFGLDSKLLRSAASVPFLDCVFTSIVRGEPTTPGVVLPPLAVDPSFPTTGTDSFDKPVSAELYNFLFRQTLEGAFVEKKPNARPAPSAPDDELSREKLEGLVGSLLKTIGKLREKSAREKAEKAGVPLKKGQPVVVDATLDEMSSVQFVEALLLVAAYRYCKFNFTFNK